LTTSRGKAKLSLIGLLLLVAISINAPGAQAFPQVGEPGEEAGQISKPNGVAVDSEEGRLYVADSGNVRVDVFDAETGAFEFAFGWKVNKENPEEKLQTCTTATGCLKGSQGSGAGQFQSPSSIAVDNEAASASHHDIYVYDEGHARVEKFSPAGVFLSQLGASGKGPCQFAPERENRHRIAIGPGGDVYVGNIVLTEQEGLEVRAEKFEPSGACIETIKLAEFQAGEFPNGGLSAGGGLAVDSSGKIYATFFAASGPRTRKFDPSGNLLGTVGLCPFANALGIDPADDLFISCGPTVEEVDSSGAEQRVFGYGEIHSPNLSGLAPFHSPSGEIFVNDPESGGHGEVLYLPFPPAGPILLPEAGGTKASPIGNTKATLNAEVNPEGKETKYHFEYLTEAEYQQNLNEGHEGFLGAKRAPASEGEDQSAGSDFSVHKVSLQIGCSNPTQQLIEEGKCLQPETQYRFRAFAENADGEGNSPVEGEPFTTKEPIEIIAGFSSGVQAESATLVAEVNPFGIPASGHFQYISDAAFQQNLGEGHDGFLGASETGEIDFGEAEEPTLGSVGVEELQPGTTYHFRLVASDLFLTEKLGPEHSFRTFAAGGKAPLPDGRVWEMVSPAVKNSGEVGVPSPAGGAAFESVEPQQASPEGAKMTYGSFTAFGPGPESAPATSQYISTLGPPFWATEIPNPRFEEGYGRDPFVGFSADLSKAALIAIEPPLTEDATPGFPNLYLRDNETGALTTITTKDHVPVVNASSGYCLAFGGASADYGRVIFSALGALNPGDPAGDGYNLYEWSAGEGIKLVSRLPNGNAATPKDLTGFGASGVATTETRVCNAKDYLLRHAISADGSRIFWTMQGSFQGAKDPLFARVDGTETIRLDKPEGLVGKPGGEGKYWDASADGSKVFFTDEHKLTPASSESGLADLYRYDFESTGPKLTNLSVQGGEAGDVQGVIGASEDGSYLYFVAKAVLDGEANSEGEVALGGEDNLYVWHEGQIRFVAGLSGEDSSDWAIKPTVQSARITPDGAHLAFLSTNSLTGYDNTVGGGAECRLRNLGEDELVGDPECAEAYLYDFESDELSCASCNPSGSRPLGPARLPSWSTPYQQPRYLSDDGSRLFFDTLDSLNPADTDERRDVYEFEQPGSGDCNEESATFVADSGGCLYLISSGTGEGGERDESYLLDASSNGEGVFFSTRRRLLETDKDERYDVYDARVGGELPQPPPPPCEGEGCREGGTEAQALPAVGTEHLEVPPEKAFRKCPKSTHRVRRKGKVRCLKAKKHQGRHRAHKNRRAGR
jgi:NHL repeat